MNTNSLIPISGGLLDTQERDPDYYVYLDLVDKQTGEHGGLIHVGHAYFIENAKGEKGLRVVHKANSPYGPGAAYIMTETPIDDAWHPGSIGTDQAD